MDIDSVAKEMRERIFDRVEDDRCLHASSIEDAIKDVLRKVGGSSVTGGNYGAAMVVHDGPAVSWPTMPGVEYATTNSGKYVVCIEDGYVKKVISADEMQERQAQIWNLLHVPMPTT